MIICFELIRHAGYNLNNVGMDELMIATIHAANGVTDYVEKIFRESIRLKETRWQTEIGMVKYTRFHTTEYSNISWLYALHIETSKQQEVFMCWAFLLSKHIRKDDANDKQVHNLWAATTYAIRSRDSIRTGNLPRGSLWTGTE